MNPPWRPVLAAFVVTILWAALAGRSPTTTYHLAPLIVAGAAPLAARWSGDEPVAARRATTLAVIGTAIALAATVLLQWRGWLDGPDITGGDGAVLESVVLAAVGGALGWWLARRGAKRAATPVPAAADAAPQTHDDIGGSAASIGPSRPCTG